MKIKQNLLVIGPAVNAQQKSSTMRKLLARFGLASAPGVTTGLTVPAAGVCAAYPVFGAPLVAVGLGGLGIALHLALWLIAPLNLVLLWLNFRRHRNPLGLLVAGPGAVFIVMVLTSHWLDAIPHDLIWPGLVLVAVGVLIDWRAQLQHRSPLRTG